MAHTNETVNYQLSQFVGTDIPNPLTDYNGDMEKIDTAIKNVANSAASESGRITALETQNGSEVLTTSAQTLSGAVNELDSDVGGINDRLVVAEGKIAADEPTLDLTSRKVTALETIVGNTVLTTTATDCTGAINELNDKTSYKILATATADGVKTEAALLNEIYQVAKDLTPEQLEKSYLVFNSTSNSSKSHLHLRSYTPTNITFVGNAVAEDMSVAINEMVYLQSSSKYVRASTSTTGTTFSDVSSAVRDAGNGWLLVEN